MWPQIGGHAMPNGGPSRIALKCNFHNTLVGIYSMVASQAGAEKCPINLPP